MACGTCCGAGCSNCGTAGGTQASPAVAAQREVHPTAKSEPSWLDQVGQVFGQVWNAVQNFVAEQVKNDNIQFALVVAPMTATFVGPIPLLISEMEELVLKGQVTRYPIEDRKELADHIHLEPKAYRIRAWLGSPNYWGATSMVSGKPILDTSPLWAAKTAFLALQKIWQERIPVWLVSNLQIIPNAVIEELRGSMRSPYTNVISVEISLQQALFGEAGDVKEGKDLDQGSKGQEGGTTTPESGQGKEEKESFLGWIIDTIHNAVTGGKKQ